MGSGACSPRKLEKLDNSDSLKLTFLHEKNVAKFMNLQILSSRFVEKKQCCLLRTIRNLLFPLSGVIFYNAPSFSNSTPPPPPPNDQLNNDNCLKVFIPAGMNPFNSGTVTESFDAISLLAPKHLTLSRKRTK